MRFEKVMSLLCATMVFLSPMSGVAECKQTIDEKIEEYRFDFGYTQLPKAEYPSTFLDYESYSGCDASDYGYSNWKAYAIYEGVDEQSLNNYLAYLEEYGYYNDGEGDALPGRYIRMENHNPVLCMPIRVEITYGMEAQYMVTAIPILSAAILKMLTCDN